MERVCVCVCTRVFGEEGELLNYFCASLISPLVSLWRGFDRPGVGGGAGLLQDPLRDSPEVARKYFGPKAHYSAHRSEGQACAPPPAHPRLTEDIREMKTAKKLMS